MKKALIVTIALTSFLLSSCEKIEDPGLGEFQMFEDVIDMSQTNQYKESCLYGSWGLSKVMFETYEDGVLESTIEVTGFVKSDITLYKDHTLPVKGSKYKGVWRYSHNCLFTMHDGGYDWYEVLKANGRVLHLKSESIPRGVLYTPFIIDKSGRHCFYVFEYEAK